LYKRPFAYFRGVQLPGRGPCSPKLNLELAVARGKSREASLEEITGRPLPARLRDALFWLFSPYL